MPLLQVGATDFSFHFFKYRNEFLRLIFPILAPHEKRELSCFALATFKENPPDTIRQKKMYFPSAFIIWLSVE